MASVDGIHMYLTSSWTLAHKLTTHFPLASVHFLFFLNKFYFIIVQNICQPFSTCSISPEDNMVASSNGDGWVCVWNIKKLKLIKKFVLKNVVIT